jgi:hypothetical protein
MSRLYFFATGTDALLMLTPLEHELGVQYVEENRLNGPTPQTWTQAADLPGLGQASGDQEILCTSLLVMPDGAEATVASRIMTDGETRYDVYQSTNPDSALLRLGGIWKDGPLISGHVISSSESAVSRKIMNAVRRSIKKSFTRVNDYWVGPEALALLRSGTRLCSAVQSPPEYDLHEEANQTVPSL